MTYAKRILSILLVLSVLCNLAIAVFASDTDSGGDASSPVDTVADEPVSEDPPPVQGEEPPDGLTDENKEPSQEEAESPETNEEDTGNPTEAEESSISAEAAGDDPASEEPIVVEEAVEEGSAPEAGDAPAEESTAQEAEDVPAVESTVSASEIELVEEPEIPEAQTAENGRAETRASGISIVHCDNAINTNGTLTISYYNYLEGANKTAYIQAIEEKRINGAVAFCLAPEEGSQGTNYTEDEQNAAWIKLPAATREAITLAMAYGYPHVSYSASADDIYWYGKQTMLDGENYIATQLIIWEFLSGVRSCYAPYGLTGSTSYRNVCDSGWNTIRTTYDAIVTKLKNHNSIPAYASGSQTAYVYELKYDSSTKTYRYLLPTERQSDWRNCLMTLPDGITYLKKADNMTVIGFEATSDAAKALPKNGYTVTGVSPSVSVDPDKAVACWQCDNSQTVATMVQKPDPAKAYFTLKLAPEGTMTAKKTTPYGTVEGYCFKIYCVTTGTTWYAKTDANGNLCQSNSSFSTLASSTFLDFPEGEYTLTEVLSKKGKDLVFPDKWTIKVTNAEGTSTTTKTYTAADMTKASNGDCVLKNVNISGLAGGGKITMTINNAPELTKLRIYKTSPDGKVDGIEFYITDSSTGQEVGRDVTDKTGEIDIDGLKLGKTYIVTEVVPQGYVCTNNNQKITMKATNNQVSFENKPLVLKLVKESSDGNNEGITFRIYSGDDNYTNGKVWKTMTTDANGAWEISAIPAGVYWISEDVPTGYAEQEDQRIEVTTANTADNPAVVTFVNEPLVLKLVKESSDGKNGNITFKIYSGDDNHTNGKVWKTMTTDANGTWEITGIPAGVYWISEDVPDGYAEQEDQRIEVTTANTEENPAVVTFVNEPLVLKLVKESSDGNNEGITFRIYAGDENYTNGTVWKTMTTDSNGTWEITGIPAGVYWIREVVPTGYGSQEDQRIEVTTANTEENPAVVTFVNEPLVLKLIKESADGRKAGITFQIYAGDTNYKSGNVWQTMKTDANGTWEITGIPVGVYWISEVVPTGYAEQEDQRIVVTTANTEENPAVVTFVNTPLPALKIVKTSPDGNVEGITFKIFNSELTYKQGMFPWKTVVTDADGTIFLGNVKPGTYWVCEVVPQGYAPQRDQTIKVTSENTPSNPATATFVNVPLRGCISVNKVNTEDTPLKGATFLLEYSTDNGETWTAVKPATEEDDGIGTCSTVEDDGTMTTGEDGIVVFDGLFSYDVIYRLTETVAPPGYQLLADPVFTGAIEANEEGNYEIYLTVVNVPPLQMPPTGGDGSVRIFGMVSTVVAVTSLIGLTTLLRKRKKE